MCAEARAPQKQSPFKTALFLLLIGLLFVLALPLLIVFGPPVLVFRFVKDLVLRLKFRSTARHDGRFILLVYSDSPNWKSYIEQRILPHVHEHAMLLNWSQRSTWKRSSWMVQAFHHWGGSYQFNPIAIVFLSLRDVRVLRFFEAFRESRRGRPGDLEKVEAELLQLVEATVRAQKPHAVA